MELAPLVGPGSRAADSGERAGREGRAGQADHPDAHRASQAQATAAAARQLRAPARRLREAGRRAGAAVPRRRDPGDAAAKRSASRGSRPTGCRRCRCRIGSRRRRRRAFRRTSRCNCSSIARSLVRPEFQVTNQNAPALASVCYHLDGIPLAIELAAARVRALSVEEIDGKLDQRFRLLTGGSRTALPRQQTLRSLHRLELRPAARAGAAALCSGWRYSRAAGRWQRRSRSAPARAWTTGDVLDLLTSLADKSLVLAEERAARPATDCWRRCASMRGTGCASGATRSLAGTASGVLPRAGGGGRGETDGHRSASLAR